MGPPSPLQAVTNRAFQGIPSLAVAPGGRLWATWYGGGVTEDKHNYIMLVTSGDDGRTWSDLKLVLDPDRDAIRELGEEEVPHGQSPSNRSARSRSDPRPSSKRARRRIPGRRTPEYHKTGIGRQNSDDDY